MTKPSRIDQIRQVASEWEFDKRIPAPQAARLLRELLGRVDELERGMGQMRLLSGLPLPPEVVTKVSEARQAIEAKDRRISELEAEVSTLKAEARQANARGGRRRAQDENGGTT